MFCPNCGTQNLETASTCTKCGFNLKGAAAPKFKGTMLMNQAPGAAPPQGPQAPMGAPPPQQPMMPPAAPMNQGLAGTVVGVPPAGLGIAPGALGAPPAPPPPGPPAPGGYGPPPGGPAFGGAAQAGGYTPPGQPQGGVNPLGGTMAIDQMPGFGAPSPAAAPPPGYGAPPPAAAPGAFPPPAGGPPGGGFGGPPPDQGFGGPPPGGQPGFGGPPGGQPGFGGPPPGGQPGFGGPPGGQPGFGGPPGGQPGFGGPPGGQPGFGGPPGGQPGFGGPPPGGQPGFGGGAPLGMPGAGAAMAGVGNPMAPMVAGAKPSVRNPIMVLVIPFGLMIGGSILGAILSMIVGFLGLLGSLLSLAGAVYLLIQVVGMLRELGNYTQDPEFNWWWIFIPCLGIYFSLIKVPEQVTKAKQKAGVEQMKPTRGIVFYLFLWPYALASDLNDIAQ